MSALLAKLAIIYVLWCVARRYARRNPFANIPGPPSSSLWTGNFLDVFNLQGWDFHQAIAEKYGGLIRIDALLGSKQLYVFDPKALHHIVVKDQEIYEETPWFLATVVLVFGKCISAITGQQHRKQRKLLYPIFSAAHMKAMVPTFYEVGHRLRTAFMTRLADGPRELDLFQWLSRTALELVGQAGLGHSFDTLTEDQINPYVKLVKEFMPSLAQLMLERQYIVPWAMKIGTPRFQRFVMRLVPWKNVHQVCDAVDIMHETSYSIYNAKKIAFEAEDEDVTAQIGRGKDILSVLMKANMDAAEEEKLSEPEVVAQITNLVFAGMDTTSTALCRALFKLAENPEIQEKLRDEITSARNRVGDDLPYDQLVSLPFMDAICRETLRLYPVLPFVSRTTTQHVVLPLSHPITGVDGTKVSEILIPKDTDIIVSILNANRHPALWGPDADKWKPERWLAPLPDSLIEARIPGVYSHILTFYGGGRSCIGFKFSQLEMKVLLSLLISTFRFTLPEGKEIMWHMSGIVTPVVKGRKDGQSSEMPLMISLVEPTEF